MAKRIDLKGDELKLFNELQKLAKTANQRILRIERYTGKEEQFAIKQLYDYLSASPIKGLTKGGRIKVSKNYTLNQMRGIIKATEKFLSEKTSKISGIKAFKKEQEKDAGFEIDLEKLDALYQTSKNYTWIYDYMTPSEFWSFVKLAKENDWNKNTWVDQLSNYILAEIDEDIKSKLEDLYDYAVRG